MDGRLNLSLMTNTPAGIIRPFRTMGGLFNLGMPWFGDILEDWINRSMSKGQRCLLFNTYHFSEGDNSHRGCKGVGFQIERGLRSASHLKKQVEHVFGANHSVVYPIVVGIETDTDALILHNNGDRLDLRDCNGCDERSLRERLVGLYPDMSERMREDLLPLVMGNLDHVRDVRKTCRTPLEMDHREQVICVGRGFDWLHLPNMALIIGPFSENWANEVAVAGQIVHKSRMIMSCEGWKPEHDGALVLCASSYWEPGIQQLRAEQRARYFAEVSDRTLREAVPDLDFQTIIGTVNMDTRSLNVIERIGT